MAQAKFSQSPTAHVGSRSAIAWPAPSSCAGTTDRARRRGHIRRARSVVPAHEEGAGHAIADLEPTCAVGDCENFACAIRQRHVTGHIPAATGPVLTTHHE